MDLWQGGDPHTLAKLKNFSFSIRFMPNVFSFTNFPNQPICKNDMNC